MMEYFLLISILDLCIFIVKYYFPEITEYAKKIGIDIETEKHLLYIAREGIVQKLPPEWKPW